MRVCHVNRALNSLDYLKREAINDSLINPKMVLIATVIKCTIIKLRKKKVSVQECFFGIPSGLEGGMR